MQYAIIAAGEGSRLAQEGVTGPKPLVKVKGETLLGRLIRVFTANDAEEIVVAVREPLDIKAEGVGMRDEAVGIPVVTCRTPSSMHTFYRIKPCLSEAKAFVLTTVDTVFREDEFAGFVKAFHEAIAKGYDGLMGVTDYVDDEKPLYVGIADDGIIEGFYDEPRSPFISAGVYGLTAPALATLKRCIERGESRMRNFQRALVAEGKRLKTWQFSKVIDIDHASDVIKAEEMLCNI